MKELIYLVAQLATEPDWFVFAPLLPLWLPKLLMLDEVPSLGSYEN